MCKFGYICLLFCFLKDKYILQYSLIYFRKPYFNKIFRKQITSSANFTVNSKTAPRTTIDASHVEKHSQLAKQWWDPNGAMIALHSYNLVR